MPSNYPLHPSASPLPVSLRLVTVSCVSEEECVVPVKKHEGRRRTGDGGAPAVTTHRWRWRAGMAQNVPSKGVKIPIDSSYWNDYNTRVVCDIFADQVATGNRPNTHLSNSGL
uniref:Uncharacterized protein n=1 Tax=Oryza rufipogon TaxID=4529 RepID=A0A0E0QP16_ORYRU